MAQARYFIFGFFLLWAAHLAAQGTIQWQRTLGGSIYDEASTIQQVRDGNIVVSGFTSSYDGDVFGNHGGVDVWVIKFDNATGNIIWKKVIGGSSSDNSRDMKPCADGGCIIAGYTGSNDFDVSGFHGETDGWVVKLDSNGAIQWQKAIGGSKRDYFNGVVQLPDGGYFLAGNSQSTDGDVHENKGYIDLWMVRLDSAGNILWSKTMGGSTEDLARAVDIDSSGNLLVAGETLSVDGDITSNHGNEDFWVIKLTPEGELIWQQTYGGEALEVPAEIHPASDHGYIVIGYTGSYESGQVLGNTGKGGLDCWVIKTDSMGALQWQYPLGGNEPDYGRSIVELDDGSFIAAGETESSDGDVSTLHGSDDAWLVKLSPTGELVWEQTYGGSMSDVCFSLTKTSDEGLAFAGYTWSEDGDLAGHNLRGKDDYWVVKLSPESLSSQEPPGKPNGQLILFPNPATESLNVRISSEETPMWVQVFDLSGRIVLEKSLSGGELLDTSKIPNGMYALSATTDNGKVWRGRVVVHHQQ